MKDVKDRKEKIKKRLESQRGKIMKERAEKSILDGSQGSESMLEQIEEKEETDDQENDNNQSEDTIKTESIESEESESESEEIDIQALWKKNKGGLKGVLNT